MHMTFRLSIMLFLAAITSLVIVGSGPAMAQDDVKLPRETLAADSQNNFDAGNRLLHSGSSQMELQATTEGLEKLGAGGHLTVLDAGTRVKNVGGPQFRIIAGPHAGQIWWLFSDEDVRKPGEVPPGAIEAR